MSKIQDVDFKEVLPVVSEEPPAHIQDQIMDVVKARVATYSAAAVSVLNSVDEGLDRGGNQYSSLFGGLLAQYLNEHHILENQIKEDLARAAAAANAAKDAK